MLRFQLCGLEENKSLGKHKLMVLILLVIVITWHNAQEDGLPPSVPSDPSSRLLGQLCSFTKKSEYLWGTQGKPWSVLGSDNGFLPFCYGDPWHAKFQRNRLGSWEDSISRVGREF